MDSSSGIPPVYPISVFIRFLAFEQVEVTGVDYEFQGVPDTIECGQVALVFTNEGSEPHEMGLARINDDVELSVEELLELPEEEAEQKVQFIGHAFAPPGEDDVVFLEVEPGRYGMVCFIPTGSTADGEETEGDGPPHFTQGMFAELTVE